MKMNASRMAIGVALTSLAAVCTAQAQSALPTAAKTELAPLKGKKNSPSTTQSNKSANKKSAAAKIPAPASDLIGMSARKKIFGTLYAAAPGAVLALGDSMLSTAMDTPFDLNPERAFWGRANIGATRKQIETSAKIGLQPTNGKSDIETKSLVAQFGLPVYTNGNTRVDATFGLGSNLMRPKDGGRRGPELFTYQASVGANLMHRAPGDIDLRLGTQLFGGSTELKGGRKADFRRFKQDFSHVGLGLRGEVSRDFPIGRGFVVTPLVGLGVTTAWVNPRGGSKSSHTSASTWVSTRLAYNQAMQSGRSASFWIEPTYINQFKRSTTSKLAFADGTLDVTSRLPRDQVGARIGMELPVGKLGSFQASLGQFWTLDKGSQRAGNLQLGYAHRF